MNNNQYSQILKLVQLGNDLNSINNKVQRLQSQYQNIKDKREKILQNLSISGINKEEIEQCYETIKSAQI